MQVIILLAGQGSRMGNLTRNRHKSLLPINNTETFLSRILHQLNEYPISKLIVVTGHLREQIEKEVRKFQFNFKLVHNSRYLEDTNIFSMNLALNEINEEEPTIIIEGDIWMHDLALKSIFESSLLGQSIWYTRGKFNALQNGGILKADRDNDIVDIKIVPKYIEEYRNYEKLVGIMSISKKEMPIFRKLVSNYCKKTIKQYYLIPWIDYLDSLPCKNVSLSAFKVESVNSKKEYDLLLSELNETKNISGLEIELIDINILKPIEGFIKERVQLLYETISESRYWIKPIIVDKKHGLILDGHHRFEVSKKMKLTKIPAIMVNYKEIKIWSLRSNIKFDHNQVVKNALAGKIYPNKTVKHDFPFSVPEISIEISTLK